MFNYSLDSREYTWKNAFLWGNFTKHCKEAKTGNLGSRFVHIFIAAAEFLPIIGQIASIFEKLIITQWDRLSFLSSSLPATEIHKVEQARKICRQNNYKHLVLPYSYKKNELFPAISSKDKMGIYIENPEHFTLAIQEYVGFLCQANFSDLLEKKYDAYDTLCETPIGRYDQITLQTEKNQGKIICIELANLFSDSYNKQENNYLLTCQHAVRLFPYHLQEIVNVAKKFDPNIETYLPILIKEKEKTLPKFKIIYEDHLNFVLTKNITFDNPASIFSITPALQEAIRLHLINFIQKENKDIWHKNCLGEDPEANLTLFEEKIPFILHSVIDFVAHLLQKKKNSLPQPISCYSQLLSCRSLVFTSNCNLYNNLKKNIEAQLDMINIKEGLIKTCFVSLLIQEILQELENRKEIAYYNSGNGKNKQNKQLLFC